MGEYQKPVSDSSAEGDESIYSAPNGDCINLSDTSSFIKMADEIRWRPSVVYAYSFTERLGNVISSARSEFVDSPHKVRTAVAGSLAVGTQVVDRARVSLILVPHIATNVLESTHQALPTAIAAGSAYALWCGFIGEALNRGLSQFPKSIGSFEDNFPATVDFFADSLPGMTSSELTNTDESNNNSRLSKAIKWLGTNMRRGTTGAGIGPTAFVGTAAAQDYPTKEISKLNLKVSADSGLVIFGLAGIVAEAIIKYSEWGNPQAAKNILNVVSDTRFWYGLAGASMLIEYLSSNASKKKLIKEDVNALSEEIS